MLRSKAESYLGFARRAGKLALGVNAIGTVKKCFLLLADPTAGRTSRERVGRYASELNCPLVWYEGLGEAVGRVGVIAAAVKDEGFARAIEDALKGA